MTDAIAGKQARFAPVGAIGTIAHLCSRGEPFGRAASRKIEINPSRNNNFRFG
jgi:hypothetical protein